MGIFVNVCENKGFPSGAKPRAGAGGGQEKASPPVPSSQQVAALLLTALFAVFWGGCAEGDEPAGGREPVAAAGAGAGSSGATDRDGREGKGAGPPAAEFRGLFLSSTSDSVRQFLAGHLLSSDPAFLAREYGNPANTAPIRAAINRAVAAGDTAVIPLLVQLFRQRGGEERIDFEVALLRFGRRAEKPLAALLKDPDPSVVLRALDALGKLEASGQVGAVAEQLLRHRDSWIRIGAAHALGEIGDTTAVAFLLEALDDSSYSVVNAAMVGLGRLRASRAFHRLIEFTGSDNPHVRKHAAMALGELGDPRAKPVLRKLATRDRDSGVRFMASRAVKALEGQ